MGQFLLNSSRSFTWYSPSLDNQYGTEVRQHKQIDGATFTDGAWLTFAFSLELSNTIPCLTVGVYVTFDFFPVFLVFIKTNLISQWRNLILLFLCQSPHSIYTFIFWLTQQRMKDAHLKNYKITLPQLNSYNDYDIYIYIYPLTKCPFVRRCSI